MSIFEITNSTTLWLVMPLTVYRVSRLTSTTRPTKGTISNIVSGPCFVFRFQKSDWQDTMSNRPFYLLASALFLASLATSILAQSKASQAARFAAISAAADKEDHEVFRNLSRLYAAEFGQIMTTSVAFLATGVVAWTVSNRRREPGLQGVPLILMMVTVVIDLSLV